MIQCRIKNCSREVQLHWVLHLSNGQTRNLARCLVHFPIAWSVYEKQTGKCRFCFFQDRDYPCGNNGCVNYKTKESEQIVSDEPFDEPFVEAVAMVDLSADELRTLMNALTVLNQHPLVSADEFPFPRRALYARLRSELEQIEGWKAR